MLYGYEPWRLEKLRGLKKVYDPKGKFNFYNPVKWGGGGVACAIWSAPGGGKLGNRITVWDWGKKAINGVSNVKNHGAVGGGCFSSLHNSFLSALYQLNVHIALQMICTHQSFIRATCCLPCWTLTSGSISNINAKPGSRYERGRLIFSVFEYKYVYILLEYNSLFLTDWSWHVAKNDSSRDPTIKFLPVLIIQLPTIRFLLFALYYKARYYPAPYYSITIRLLTMRLLIMRLLIIQFFSIQLLFNSFLFNYYAAPYYAALYRSIPYYLAPYYSLFIIRSSLCGSLLSNSLLFNYYAAPYYAAPYYSILY